MSHLTHAELARWRDEGLAADRERVLTHMAGCEACRREYAAIVREESPADEPAPAEFVARGYAAFPRKARWTRAALAGVPLTAAALLAAALLPWTRRSPVTDPADTQVRGGEIQLLSPIGTVPAPASFRWTSPVAAARFRLIVRDDGGAVVHESTTAREEAAAPALQPARRYSWTVEALDGTGEVFARSASQAFTIASPGP